MPNTMNVARRGEARGGGMQIFSSPVWSALGVIVAIVFGVISVVYKRRSRKALAYEVLSNVSLVTVRQELLKDNPDAIEIRYHGTLVNDVRVLVMRIWNAGNVPIVPSDYHKPIMIVVDGKMLTAAITKSVPIELQNEVLDRAGLLPDNMSLVQLHPVLLNPGDSITIQVLLTDSLGVIDPRVHAVGVTNMEHVDRRERAKNRARLAYLAFFGFAGLVGIFSFWANQLHPSVDNLVIAVLYSVISVTGIAFVWFRIW